MNSIALKSTGQLIDEYITSTFKNLTNPTPENFQRYTVLYNICNERLGDRRHLISSLYDQLTDILWQCWSAQEIIGNEDPSFDFYNNHQSYSDLGNVVWLSSNYETLESIIRLAKAGKMAQKTNAIRCQLVRDIDKVLGETDRTYLEKTYA